MALYHARLCTSLLLSLASAGYPTTAQSEPHPKVILISLDGATPRFIERYLATGELPANQGFGLLRNKGLYAKRVYPVTPSLTAPNHITLVTGVSSARHDIIANKFHAIASSFPVNSNGFKAAIGGYAYSGSASTAGPSVNPTVVPLWTLLDRFGRKVAAATFPGADGLDVKLPGVLDGAVIQSNAMRTADYTVPYGETIKELGMKGFALRAADFTEAPAEIKNRLLEIGKYFWHARQKTSPLESFTIAGTIHQIQLVALDTSDDEIENYDSLVVFDSVDGIQPGPFALPETGPSYLHFDDRNSATFSLQRSPHHAGTAFYVSRLDSDLHNVHIARYGVSYTPHDPLNLHLAEIVDDTERNVGFSFPGPKWPADQSGFAEFPDSEREAIYEDEAEHFADFQTRLALHAISRNPDADLLLTYLEQPDGSEHRFLLTDPRQAADLRDGNSINALSEEKARHYANYLLHAYQLADKAVQRLMEKIGFDADGRPNSNIIAVSDHGAIAYHTAIHIGNFLNRRGFDPAKVRAVTVGPVANFYINLRGREPDGTVNRREYLKLRKKLKKALENLHDTNPHFIQDRKNTAVVDKIYLRPIQSPACSNLGFCENSFIGRDSGDILAILKVGYSFSEDLWGPPRQGDPASDAPLLSLPKDYGAHGYDSTLPEMSAIFFAAGPDIPHGSIESMQITDIAPFILKLLNVAQPAEMRGTPPVIK